VRQSRLGSGERLTLRLAPFYQDRHQGSLRSRFYLWPAYRTRLVEDEEHSWARRDFLLVVGRYSEEVQFSPRSSRALSTLFPIWRISENDGAIRGSLPAILDSLFPHNPTIRSLYAPLCQLYDFESDGDGTPRWSLLWDLVSSDGITIRYPVRVGASAGPERREGAVPAGQ
jgi:hypothetical protein